MATKPTFITHVFWILAVAMAVNFMLLLLAIGITSARGMIPRERWYEVFQVLTQARVALPRSDIEDLRRFREKEATEAEAERFERGAGPVPEYARKRAEEEAAMRGEEARLLGERLKLEEEKIAALRREIETVKQTAEDAISALAVEKEKATTVALAEETARLQKTFANMDAGDIATDFNVLAAGREEGLAYVAELLKLLKPTQASEILTEMTPELRQRIWPLLQNEYANLPPEKVAAEWKERGINPLQMKEYLRSMPPAQGLGVLRRLDRATREEVENLLAPLNPSETLQAAGG
ncbi:MAG: hypothetical protein V1918_09790 [Planctomycetota bacterium]